MKQILTVISLSLIVSCGKKYDEKIPQEFVGNAIGTTYGIKLFHDEKLAITEPVDSIIDMFNQSMSTWVQQSDISKINRGDSTVVVGEAFKEVFDAAQEIHKRTQGYFDPTVGNLVNAYGFGAQGEQDVIPSQAQVDSLLQFVGYSKMNIIPHQDGYKLVSSQSGMYLEFNAIAKGTLVDYIAKMLDKKGVKNYLVEVGGEVVATGINLEKGTPWLVGIDDPKHDTTGTKRAIMAVHLTNKAMAGSGNYRKFKIDPDTGIEYAHTVNPLTGKSQPTQVIGVNVIANNCTLADGYATAFMAMPLEKSKKLIHEIPDIEVIIMYFNDYGMLQFEKTAGFEQYIKK